ncbi:GntR family transcriptional regulator [Caulobacter sp. SLTY]|uniref:FadR/GntR family transcriptional regulator n=1 Tax=Caulobacter sp. SLTY TaxID=2683262 RepID=UPI001412D921|nr:GntR family transcriptional regulator [Caulobacter sp. SLTY]NBB16493.1 GntR family transcriptional regulator [Caulobacter sp. SLTY]
MFDSAISGSIRIPKTAEVLASRVRKAIIRGELKPGDKLPSEAQLITDFEVSRPTIREAIRILESEGLISVSRGARGGARVNAVSSEMITKAAGIALQARGATMADIYTARSLIEPPAARYAAETRPKEAAAALRAQLEIERTIGGQQALAAAIAEFHRVLLDECGNIALGVVGKALQDVVELHMQLSIRANARSLDVSDRRTRFGLRSQEKLIELIEAGDGPGAEAHWISHMAAAGKVWLEGVDSTAVVDVVE